MSEEIVAEDVTLAAASFFEDIKWELIRYNQISKEDFIKLKIKNPKLYATFLGQQDQLAFFLFKPLTWECYKEIRTEELDKYETHERILQSSLLWPVINEKNTPDAGTVLTLVYQILAQSSFLKNPLEALKMIVEI